MRIVRRSASRLVLRETPLNSWLMAAFCFSVGILGILLIALDSSWLGGWMFAGLGALGGVVVMLGAGAVVTLDFDRHGGTLTVRRWLFGSRVTTYPIRDLVSVEVESTTDDEGVACYRISLNTASKETITPVSAYSNGADKHTAAGVIREFLGLHGSDDPPAPPRSQGRTVIWVHGDHGPSGQRGARHPQEPPTGSGTAGTGGCGKEP